MRVRSSRFVGRGAELAQLGAWLDDARQGQPRVVIIGGEAGVGKSRLVEEFRRIAEEQGAAWLFGAAADYGAGGLPFGALVQALRPAVGDAALVARLGSARTELARLFPNLNVSAPGRTAEMTARPADELSRLRLLEALLSLIGELARQRPAVLVLEDLHWADASTREFLAFLARNLGTTPLLVVGTYRADDVSRGHPLRRYLAELSRLGTTERLELARLDRGELRQLVEAIRGRVDERLIDELYARSQGNAFFSEELLAAARADAAPVLPASVREMVLARVEGLGAGTKSVLAAAAVFGMADEQLLGMVSGLTADELSSALREAIDQSVLVRGADSRGGYTFRHALAREAIYDDLLAGERVRLHERAAEALAQWADARAPAGGPQTADAQQLAGLAHHWRQAGRPQAALLASWRAGEAAERLHAYPEASLHFEHVLALWPQVEDAASLLDADRAAVALRAGRAATIASDHARAQSLLRSAVAEIDAGTEPDRAAHVQLVLLTSLVTGGDAAGGEVVRRQLEELSPACAPTTRLQVLNGLVWYFEHYGELARSLALSQGAISLAESVGTDGDRAWLHSRAGRSRAFVDNLEAGLAELQLARSIALTAGDDAGVGGIDKDIGIVLQSAGRFEEAIAAFTSSQRYLEPLGMHNTTRHTDAEIGFALHRLGRWQEADAALERALAPPAVDWGYVVRAYVLVATGRLEDGERELVRAWPSVDVSQASTSYGPYFTALGHKALWEGRPGEALAAAEEGLRRVATTENVRWMCELTALGVRAAADAGATRRVDVERLVDVLRSRTKEGRPEMRMFDAEGRAWLATAEAELSRFELPDRASWARAANAWSVTGRPHEFAYVLFRQAEAMLGSGSRDDARGPLSEAWRHASSAGARLLVDAIEDLARRARLEVGESAGSGRSVDSYGLTARERDVLALVARGHSDQQIAEELFISPKTASVHVSNIKAKLGVEHRIEAAAIGAGLTAEPADT